MLSAADRHAGDTCAFLVDHDPGERSIEDGHDAEPDSAERRDERQIRARDGQDRAEEVLEEIDVQRTSGRDENHPERDARVEDERKGLITCGPAARAQQLDRDAAHDCEDERGEDRRHVEQDPRRDAGERDMSDAVARQRLPALHEEEPDSRRQHTDDGARAEREPHELSLEHGHATGRARRPGARRCTVEDDRSPDEDDPLDEALDGPELVGDVDDRHAEIRVQLIEQRGQGLLRLRIDTCGRLVQNEERRAARKGLRNEGTLLHAAGERPDGNICLSRQTDALDRLGDELAITPAHRPEQAARQPTGGDDLAYRRRSVTAELGALREVPEGAPSREAVCRLAIESRSPLGRALEPEQNSDERRLAAAVRPGDRDELSFPEHEIDFLEDPLSRPVAERDAGELGG